MSKNTLRIAGVADLPEHLRAGALAKLGQQPRTNLPELLGADLSEHDEQVAFINRIEEIAAADARYAPAVRRTFAIPNGGHRDKATAGKLRAEGVKSGVSDIQCAVPCGHASGLFIEFKKKGYTYPTPDQREFIDESIQLGYVAVWVRGCDEALVVWKSYVEGCFT